MNCSTRSSLAARRISSSARALARVAIRISMASMLLITRCTTEWPKAKRKVSHPWPASSWRQRQVCFGQRFVIRIEHLAFASRWHLVLPHRQMHELGTFVSQVWRVVYNGQVVRVLQPLQPHCHQEATPMVSASQPDGCHSAL